MFHVKTALAAVFAAQLCWAAPTWAADGSEAAFRTTTLSLSAQGEARLKPDMATISLGVTGEAATAQAATAAAMAQLNAVVAALKRAGVAEKDIQTEYVRVYPRFSEGGANAPREIVAQRATTTVRVITRDIGRAGALLDAALGAGANQVQDVRFGLADPSAAQRKARDAALAALRADAEQVAAAMGQKVVRLVSVSTQAHQGIPPLGAPPVGQQVIVTGSRIEPGEVVVQGNASAVYELAPR